MCDTRYEKMDNGQLSGVVFLDIRKAFDSIDHTILLQKMNDQFGIKNVELDWFKSYLTNREQACIVNGAMSSPKTIVCGVPQGSILGPLLFLLYINDFPECLEKTSPHLYADDTQISTSAKTIEELTENLNNDLKKVVFGRIPRLPLELELGLPLKDPSTQSEYTQSLRNIFKEEIRQSKTTEETISEDRNSLIKANGKLKQEIDILSDQVNNYKCIASDLHTKVKQLEDEQKSLITAIGVRGR
ncbi:Hypothetical predicted protein [Paramuricea clavata]|uniref:Uncharacterized protein n=1 Tax=Paramuricea clavata TaxID=317549 RepID=A0A7D9EE03_PARCT|nr:Hypothetical predicted protein [Paramuricea clavata]